MIYTPYHYRRCIRSLGRSRARQKTAKKAAGGLFVIALLLCASLVLRDNPAFLPGVSDSVAFPKRNPDKEWLRPVPADTAAITEAADAKISSVMENHPGARQIWDQDFQSILEKTRVTVAAGDTLFQILRRNGLAGREAYDLTQAMRSVFNPAHLRQGQELSMGFVRGPQGSDMLQVLSLSLDAKTKVEVMRGNDHRFKARMVERQLQKRPARFAADVDSSLYQAARDQGLPISVLMKLVRVYSYDVDFQRDLRSGDRVEILYEEKTTPEGRRVEAGDILYAAIRTNGRTLRVYRHETRDGNARFFDSDGNSVRKALMVTPIDGAVLSSGYGMRRHPILGYNRMHKGLDFAAPKGTPIMAGGDGVVTYAGPRGSYGNYVHIRHPNNYETVYAHLSRHADGIQSGKRVKQGETIGYVGSTGRSTGPHLHYEIRHAGKSINPSNLKAPPGRGLEGDEMQRFLATKGHLENLYASLADSSKLAMAEAPGEQKNSRVKN
ncbi:MAG: M23 family metallopeptidase [Desulfobacterales bacterium]|nr:M23 family metallopeptidase [Desulfobacterales bacterium]